MARFALLVVGVVVLGLVAAGVWVVTLDPNRHKATIERWASDALGDAVQIGGPIVLTRGLTPSLVVNDLRISADARAEPMVAIQRAELSLVLTSLLWGPLHLPRVALDTAQLDLPLQGGAAAEGAGKAPVPRIDRLEASNIKVRYRQDDGGAFDFTVERANVAPAADGATTTLEMTATVAALPLKVTGTTGPVAALFASGAGLPIEVEATLADGKLGLTGSLSLQGGDLDYRLDSKLELPAASKLAESFKLPATPLEATGKLQGDRNAVAVQGLSATWGKSDLAGDLTWQVGQAGARGKLSGKLAAQRIDAVELGLGAPSAPAKPTDGVVPNLALPSPAGLPVELDLGATVGQLDLWGVALTDLSAAARGDASTLDLSVTQAKLGGGDVQGRYQVGGEEPPDVAFRLDAATVDLATLMARPKDGSELPRNVNVKIDLTGRGADLRAFLGSASGTIAIGTGAAVFRSKFADMLGKSLFTSIIPGLNSSGRAHIICSVLDLEAKDGKARSTALVIDGKHAVIGGGGAIELASGNIDFVLLPTAKNATLAPLVTPVHLAGTITDPKLVGDAASLLGSTTHLLLGIVNPLSLATPVLHPGLKGGEPCRNPSVVQRSDPVEKVGGTAIDAVEDTAKGVGSALEEIGKGAGKLLEGITGN